MALLPFRCSIMGLTLLSFTTPQPTCVHGATGETGVVPDKGSHVEKDGYQAERFNASRRSSLVIEKLTPFTINPILLSGSAPEDRSPNSDLRLSSTSERSPAVLGVANEVPDVQW